MNRDELFEAVQKLGIHSPENPSEDDLKRLFEAAYMEHKLELDVLGSYVQAVAPAITAVFEALQEQVRAQGAVSARHMENLNLVLQICREKLRGPCTPEETRWYLELIRVTLAESKAEANANRRLTERGYYVAAGSLLVAVGVVLLVVSKGRWHSVLAKGGQMVVKGISNAV